MENSGVGRLFDTASRLRRAGTLLAAGSGYGAGGGDASCSWTWIPSIGCDTRANRGAEPHSSEWRRYVSEGYPRDTCAAVHDRE